MKTCSKKKVQISDNKQIEIVDNRKTKYSQFDNLIYGYTTLELGQDPGLCGSREK